jgi:two-component sensor histidine kinase
VKNTLAIVQSLAHQSFHSSTPAPDAIGRFEGRLEALAAAHNLLTRKNWDTATIADVATAALAPFVPESRRTIEGPDVSVQPQTAVGLALALHELATNAAKYGALSRETGRIVVSWTVTDGELRLEWREEGGPPVSPPEHRGFGSRMIERTLAAEFGGKVQLDFRPEGVVCTVVAPLPSVA